MRLSNSPEDGPMMRSRAWRLAVGLAMALGVALGAMSCGCIYEAVSDETLGFATEHVALRVEGMT